MFRHNFLSLSLLSPAVLFLSVGSAQAEEPVFSFDNVVVSASKDEQRLGDVDSSMMLIQDLDIQAMVADSVDDLFQFTPGVTVSGAQNRGSGAINIRGITGNRVLTQVDGVRQPKELTFGFLGSSRHAVDLNTIKQVEVIPGPASSLYGSDALGGVVSYITKDPADILNDDKDGSAGSARTYYDSADKSWGQSLTLANRQGKLETMAVISSRKGEEIKNKGEAGSEADPKDSQDLNVMGKLKYQINDAKYIKLMAERLKNEESIDALSNATPDTRFEDEKRRSRVSVEFGNAKPTAAYDSMTAKLDWQKSTTDQLATYPSQGQPASYDSDYRETSKSLKLDFKKAIATPATVHNLSYGGSLDSTEFEQWRDSSTSGIGRGMPLSDSESISVYLQDQITLGESGWRVTPGLRFDRYSIDPKPDADYLASNPYDANPEKNTGEQLSAKLGATYDFNDNHSVFGQFAQGYKAPDMNQLYENFDRFGAYAGKSNPDLEPESVDSFELGYRFENDKVNLELSAFHNDYENFIESVNLGPTDNYPYGIFQNQNLSGVTIKGAEAKGRVRLSDTVQVRGALAYAKGTVKENGESEPLNSVSPLQGTLGIGYDAKSKRWGTELLVRAASGKKDSDVSGDDNFLSAGYGVVDITAYQQISKNLRLDAGIFNITDKQYWEWETARLLTADDRINSEAARSVRVGLTLDF